MGKNHAAMRVRRRVLEVVAVVIRGLGGGVARAQAPAGDGVGVLGASVYTAGTLSGPTTFGPVALTTSAGSNTVFLACLTHLLLPTHAATLASEATVFPNPATGRFTRTLPLVAGATATLATALGQVVLTRSLTAKETELDVRGLPAGVYVLRVLAEHTTAVRRVVIE